MVVMLEFMIKYYKEFLICHKNLNIIFTGLDINSDQYKRLVKHLTSYYRIPQKSIKFLYTGGKTPDNT